MIALVGSLLKQRTSMSPTTIARRYLRLWALPEILFGTRQITTLENRSSPNTYSFPQKQDGPNNGNYANAFYRRQRRPRGYKTTTGFINARQALYS
jgi:hypothetical protein